MKKDTNKKISSGKSKSTPSKFRIVLQILLFLALVSTLTSVMTLYLEDLPQNLEVGEIAKISYGK
jgi:hypothetical protein